MKQLVTSLLFAFFVINAVFSQVEKKVLFIGNSHTFYNDVPKLVQDAATSTGDILNYEESTFGGYSIKSHLENTETMDKVRKGGWDYVVVQGRGGWPALWDEFVETNVYPYMDQMKDSISKYSPCSKMVLYHTWGYEDGYPYYCPDWPGACDYESMDDLIQVRFKQMATRYNAILAPAGPVWRKMMENDPKIDPFHVDHYHANLNGSFASALSIYTVLFEKDADLVTSNPGLYSGIVTSIKEIVSDEVYDKLPDWITIDEDKDVDFEFNLTSSLQVSFTNLTDHADSYLWDFGDGNTSTDVNPTHTYAADGNYTVQLTVNRCGTSFNTQHTVNTIALSTTNFDKNTLTIYPNPVKDHLKLKLSETDVTVSIYDTTGKRIYKNLKPAKLDFQIDVSLLKKGLYFVKITKSPQQFTSKAFVKN